MFSHSDALNRVFAALADLTRRAILAHLKAGAAEVGEDGARSGLSQPTVSRRRLKVRDRAGLATHGRDAERRPRVLVATPLRDVDDWIETSRRFGTRQLDSLDGGFTDPQAKSDAVAAPNDEAFPRGVATPSSARELGIERTFDAPRVLVFAAWTLPEHATRWCDPSGVPLAACEIDLRPGGRFRVMHATYGGAGEGPAPAAGDVFADAYHEDAPLERPVFTARAPPGANSVGAPVFAERDGKTTLTITYATADAARQGATRVSTPARRAHSTTPVPTSPASVRRERPAPRARPHCTSPH